MSDSKLGGYVALGLVIGVVVGLIAAPYISQALNIPLVSPVTITETATSTVTSTEPKTVTSTVERVITQFFTTTSTRYVTLTSTSVRYFTTTAYSTVTTTPYTARIIEVDLRFKDHRPVLGSPSLIVTGYLVNAGSRPAYEVTIHVTFYQGNVKTTKDIVVGNIYPGQWKKIDTSIPYTGSAITNVEYIITWS